MIVLMTGRVGLVGWMGEYCGCVGYKCGNLSGIRLKRGV